MRRNDIERACREAREFLKRAKEIQATPALPRDDVYVEGGKLGGALTRQSMELTRALADLRHPWRK